MKKIFLIILAIIFVTTGCTKEPASVKDKIAEHYKTVFEATDTSVIRNEIADLEKLSKDASISEEERMFAQYTYNVAYGIAKLGLSGKAISFMDFPEMEMLSGTVGAIANEEIEIENVMVEESLKFLQKVEKFLQ